MTEPVLLVDDEPNVLEGIRRQLHKKVSIETATSGQEGLTIVQESGPFAVVISDMRMPGMNGAEFLGHVRKIHPDSVRIILSGQAELDTTIAAVNEGHIFRFLTKPCSGENLWATVEAGLEQYRLVNAERELLEKTLSGAVTMLNEILGLTNPVAYSRASRIQRYADDVGAALGMSDQWQFRLAAMLSQIGCITLPGETLAKIYAGQNLSEEEKKLYDAHPELAGKLLGSIPRLEPVAEMIAGQLESQDLSALPEDVFEWDSQILGTVILHAAAELDNLLTQGVTPAVALGSLGKPSAGLPPQVVKALRTVQITKDEMETRSVRVSELRAGMVLDEDMMSSKGIPLVSRGQVITNTTLIRLQSYADGVGVAEPFRVLVPQ